MKTAEDLQRSLKHTTETHQKLSDALRGRLKLSQDAMSERYKKLAENEKQYASYVPARVVDDVRKNKRDSLGEYDFVSIEVPYSYAVIMTIHTYITSVFLSRNPIYQVSGRHGETEMQTQSMEALLDYQLTAGQHLWPLYCALLDPLKGGFGVIGQYWEQEEVNVRSYREEIPTFLGMPIPGKKPQKVPYVEKVPGFQGTKLFNVRQQDFFPDTRLPLSRFQEGEFVGRYVEIPWNTLFDGARDGRFFNVKAAKDTAQGTNMDMMRDRGAEQVTKLPGDVQSPYYYDDKPAEIFRGYELQWRLRPEQWKLGEESGLETWVFTISERGIVVEARPLACYMKDFTYSIFMTEPDAYGLFPISALERVKPLNDVLSWLINTHFYNVRSTLNNQFIVDPSMVVMKDVLSRQPGQIIRLKPEAYGRDIRAAIAQLPTADVTRSHINDAGLVESMIQRTLGATDNVMGMVNEGGRKTATEVRTSTSFGVNRIKTICEILGASGFASHIQHMVQLTQQYYEDSELKYKLVGDLSNFTPQARSITPDAIAGFYDFVPVDGTLPVDRYAQAQLWNQLLGQVQNYPQIVQQYDMAKLFAWIGTLAGLKNIQQFRVTPQDPGMLGQQVQAGNMVPISSAMKDLGRVPDAGRPPMMGATG